MELDAYIKANAIDFMVLQDHLRSWEVSQGIFCGPGRGSVSGSEIAYILGITEMDSIKFDLNFSRFINKDRMSMADIDTDYGNADRERVRKFILEDKMGLPNLQTSYIISFNTIAMRGAIRDVGRALSIPLDIVAKICDESEDEITLAKVRKNYPELFKYVDIVMGTIVSIGLHACGIVVSDIDLGANIGLCTLSSTDYPVSMVDMTELDAMNYVKLDILGLDNVALINETCKLAGIERVTPDTIELEDVAVWKSIAEDTTGIFQWESPFASQYISKLFAPDLINKIKVLNKDFSYLKWMSFGNGLLRPGSNSYRDDILTGIPYDNGLKEINEFLAKTLGRVCMQEDIMGFLVKFCGYSSSESDTVRRGIAKKKGTEKLLPEIEERFIKFTSTNYGISEDTCRDVIRPFIQVITDASAYAFSWNHSDSYSYIGYACGYLRYYYPFEFITSALNLASDDEDRTRMIIGYAAKRGIKVLSPVFGFSKSTYGFDKATNSIYKGVSSIKYMNDNVSKEMNELYLYHKEGRFVDLLYDITERTHVNKSQVDILIRLNYFKNFGNINTLLEIYKLYGDIGNSKIVRKNSMPTEPVIASIISRNSKETAQQFALTSIIDIMAEIEDYIKSKNLPELSVRETVQTQQEYLGYIDFVTGSVEDRRKLLIVDIEPIKMKNGKFWARRLKTHSIGTGKNSEILIFENLFFKNPIYKYDVIFVSEEDLTKKVNGKFINWYLNGYRKV
jgi:DNA polymerase-3 subunit alpha